MADQIQTDDLRRFNATRCPSGHTTLWEGLAILVALRNWEYLIDQHTSFEIRADSFAALLALQKGSSRTPGLNKIMSEIALMEAERGLKFLTLTHILGLLNTWPDALSRHEAPEPKVIPPALLTEPGTSCEPRDRLFWRTEKQ